MAEGRDAHHAKELQHTFPLFPGSVVRVFYFEDVTNAKDIVKVIRSGEIRGGLVRAEKVISTFVLLSAAGRVLHNSLNKQLKTRGLGTELLYQLSASKSINFALKTFGVGEDCTSLLAVLFDPTDEEVSQIKRLVAGTLQDPRTIDEANEAKTKALSKLYKIRPQHYTRLSLGDAIANLLAVRDFTK